MAVRKAPAPMLALLAAAALAGCGAEQDGPADVAGGEKRTRIDDPGPIHVHGLGVNPRDGALFLASHTGLFRAGPGELTVKRVGDRFQDTMGFTVVGRDRFLGSGHPDGRDRLPPFLGLIESRDAGRSWTPVSLLGKRDFHVLEARGKRVYGFGSNFKTRDQALVVSDDGGRSWRQRRTPETGRRASETERRAPETLTSLAIDRRRPDRVVASGGWLHTSTNAGRSWRPLPGDPGLLAWPSVDRLYRVGADGRVSVSRDAGRGWRAVGAVGGEPAAFLGHAARDLYVALHDGTIKRSTDGGASWSIRSRP